MSKIPKHVLSIGGVVQDPIAGLARDMEVFRAMEIPCSVIVTELTTQGSDRRGESFAAPLDYFKAALAVEVNPQIVKIGLLSSIEHIVVLGQWLKEHKPFVLYDPVFESSRGLCFQTAESRQALVERLLPHVHILTPNSIELEWLLGSSATLDIPNVIVTGGHDHFEADYVMDTVVTSQSRYTLRSPRQSGSMRGSGCLFTAVLAGVMATVDHNDEQSLVDAIVKAKCLTAVVWRTKTISFDEVLPEDFPECWIGTFE